MFYTIAVIAVYWITEAIPLAAMSLLLEYLLLERLLSIISMTLTCCLWAGSWLPWRLRSGIFTRG